VVFKGRRFALEKGTRHKGKDEGALAGSGREEGSLWEGKNHSVGGAGDVCLRGKRCVV